MTIPLLITIATFASTMIGGLFALRFRDHLHLILGFSAGAILGVAFFDLIPEALNLSLLANSRVVTIIIALGFAIYLIIDRTISLHAHNNKDCHEPKHQHYQRGLLGAASLSIHSLLDGLAIGFSFQVSPTVGLVVAAAVLTHDFSDGINTVGVILKGGGTWRQAFRWLLVDAIAPVVGIIITFFFVLPAAILGIFLALFAGFFLYLGASELLPESHHDHPTAWTTIATILGMATLFIVTKLAGI